MVNTTYATFQTLVKKSKELKATKEFQVPLRNDVGSNLAKNWSKFLKFVSTIYTQVKHLLWTLLIINNRMQLVSINNKLNSSYSG